MKPQFRGPYDCQTFSATSTQALHTLRINLSPFTKDFRVWGATIEHCPICLTATQRRLPYSQTTRIVHAHVDLSEQEVGTYLLTQGFEKYSYRQFLCQ